MSMCGSRSPSPLFHLPVRCLHRSHSACERSLSGRYPVKLPRCGIIPLIDPPFCPPPNPHTILTPDADGAFLRLRNFLRLATAYGRMQLHWPTPMGAQCSFLFGTHIGLKKNVFNPQDDNFKIRGKL